MNISLVLTTYNSQKTICRALDSLVKLKSSTNHKFSILVIDDSSSDDTLKFLNIYERSGLLDKIIKNKENRGVSFSRNVGIEHSLESDYVMFLDSDDELIVDALEACSIDRAPDLILAPFLLTEQSIKREISFYEQELQLNLINQVQYFTKYLNAPNKNNLLTTCWAKLFKTELLRTDKSLRFDEDLVICEDTKFVFDFFKKANVIYYLDIYFYHHIIESQNIQRGTFAFSKRNFDSCLSFLAALKSCQNILREKFSMNLDEINLLMNQCRGAYLIIYFIRSAVFINSISTFMKRYFYFRKVLSDETFKETFKTYSSKKAAGGFLLPMLISCNLYFIASLYSFFLYKKRYK